MSSEAKKTIAAAIVTYEPDLLRLSENLRAVSPQVDKAYIYDNGSSNREGIEALLEDALSPISLYASGQNDGMAIALNRLAGMARSEGYEQLLLLDQDSVVDDDMIQLLLEVTADDVAIVAPVIVDRCKGEVFVGVDEITEEHAVITSGALLNLAIHKNLGGYDERLFVDHVDYEYCYNAVMHGYRILKQHKTSLLHEYGRLELAVRIPRRDANGKWQLRPYYRTNHALFRRKDIARSAAIVMDKYHYTSLYPNIKHYYGKFMLKTLLFEKSRVQIVRATAAGWREGRRIVKDR